MNIEKYLHNTYNEKNMEPLFNPHYQSLIKIYLNAKLIDVETQNLFLTEIQNCINDNGISFNEKIAIINFLTTGLHNPLEEGETPLDLTKLVEQRYILLLNLYEGYEFESKEEEDLFAKHINIIVKTDKMDFNTKILLLNILCAQLKAGIQIA
jgi:hypothetical protein